MTTTTSPTLAPASTAPPEPPPTQISHVDNARAAAPSAEGQLNDLASEHNRSESIVEEKRSLNTQSVEQSSKSSSNNPARKASQYALHELQVDKGQPSELGLTPEEPDYFESLVANTLETRALPVVRPIYRGSVESSPLYPSTPGQTQVTSQDLSGEHGTALALELALKLQTNHTKAQVRYEMIKVATAASTSNAGLNRMRDILSQLSELP